MTKMKKYLFILACAIMAFACTPKVNPDNEVKEYAGSRASVELSTTDRIPAEGGTLKATVHRSPAFTVSAPKTADWLSCAVADSVVTVTVKANQSAVARAARLSVIDKELNISVTSFEVVQNGTEKDIVRKNLQVSTQSIIAKAEDTSASFSITSDVAWTVSSSNPAFVPSPASGEGNGKVTVTFPANAKTEEVTAEITVSTTDEGVMAKDLVVTIKQEAAVPDNPAVKPAPGTVLAEWEFETAQAEALRAGGFEKVSLEDDNLPGNVGNPYVPSQVSGKGKIEYYNGSDKSAYSTKKHKRRIGSRGEPCIYGSWKDDYFTWTAPAENDAPLAAGTKIQLNFALRPNAAGVMRDWKCEVLDGDNWKELEAVKLEFHPSAAGTAADPKQVNAIIVRSATLTKDTPYACFRFTCTSQFNSAGEELSELVKGDALRFAGKYLEATEEDSYLQVPENPKIMVVE